MQIFSFLAAFLLVRRLQKALKDTALHSKWNLLFIVAMISIAVLYLAGEERLPDWANGLLGGLLLLSVISYVKREPDFKLIRPYADTNIPLVIAVILIELISLITPAFYERWDNYLDWVILGAFVWIFARLANSRKQQAELKIISGQKSELETLVAERTAELTRQKDELLITLQELKVTQSQLIQSEKMASLGELTAGIAHEIQNPLNFVNNFSEVNIELMAEMQDELDKGDTAEAVAIAEDIKQNLEKIRHHGRRADGIVKGMLQHSRASSNVKELTDINKLADEYFRLAYHGLRAKDKTFNAELVTDFAAGLPQLRVVPQDIGRVLLNLFTNAFYAVQQKQAAAGAGYKPVVAIATKLRGNTAEITVNDNGTGIPDQIKEKILQPFFTTKPAGEGTGLGLSLSYDIVVKGHGGQISIDSKEGAGSTFLISLPANV